MATVSTYDRLFKAAVVIVFVLVCVVESSRLPRPFPPFSGRGGSRRFAHHRFGADVGGRRRTLPTPPPIFREPGPAAPARRLSKDRLGGSWFKDLVKEKGITPISRKTLGQPTTAPTGVSRLIPHHRKIGTFTINVIETINMSTLSSTSAQLPLHDPPQPRETSKIRTFPADKVTLRCEGPNEVDQAEECYQFDLSNDLSNDSVINHALVLFYAESRHHAPRHGGTNQNISIVAKFPTSGQGAFQESIVAQNSSFDIPPAWQKAALNQGPSIITRALLEGNRLVLKMSVITDNDGQATSNNYIPMKTHMLPVLVVDIVNNQTEDQSTPDSTTPERPLNSRENALGRLRHKRRSSPALHDSNDLHHKNHKCPGCNMKSVPVNFNELIPGFGTVIYPMEDEVNVCAGTCSGHDIPLSLQENTNGAEASDAHRGNKKRGGNSPGRLRCLPSRTRDLSVLFVGEDDKIYATIVPDLLVDECSCQLQ